jgi:hypothetical protein
MPEDLPGSAEETLRRLEARLDRASAAAERLMAQAAEAAGGEAAGGADPAAGGEPGKPPPSGWQIPEDARSRTDELDPFLALAQALRDLVPPELQRRLAAAIRELLLALRALIDWYLERVEQRRDQAVDVQDIPIL